MKLAVVLNYKNYQATIKCTNQLLLIGINIVVIVDNGSANDSFAYLDNHFKSINNVIVLSCKDNKGYASGNNVALKYIAAKFKDNNDIFIVNPDTKVTRDAVDQVSRVLNSTANVGLVTTLRNSRPKSAWHHLTPHRALLFNSWVIRWILFKFKIEEHQEYQIEESIQKVDVVQGAFFCVKQATFEAIGFFDEGTFLFYEEEILYRRLQKRGFQNYLITTASVYHEGHGSSGSIHRLQFKQINDRSRLYLLTKYYQVGASYRTIYRLTNRFDNWLFKVLGRSNKPI